MVKTVSERTHYETLRVARKATREQIRAAFRRLAKIYHPDKNPGRSDWAQARTRELIDAYEILADERRRAVYDRRLGSRRPGLSFTERMRSQPHDLAAQSKLILHYLLKGDFDRGIELHEGHVLRRPTFSMVHHLEERDYLDALFLLGEAYEDRRQWRTALRYYWEVYELERSGPKRRFFFDELKDRLRVLFSQRLIRGLSPQDTLKNYRRAIALGIGNRDAALIYKKIAGVESQLGHETRAVEALDRAKKLCPGMKTLDDMRKKIAGD
jgi:tetratricopeptide (TPR) repeat protein